MYVQQSKMYMIFCLPLEIQIQFLATVALIISYSIVAYHIKYFDIKGILWTFFTGFWREKKSAWKVGKACTYCKKNPMFTLSCFWYLLSWYMLSPSSFLPQFEKWTDSQRKQVLQDFFSRCSVNQLKHLRQTLSSWVPEEALDFTRVLPRVISLYIFSFLDPRSLCRCAQVCIIAIVWMF